MRQKSVVVGGVRPGGGVRAGVPCEVFGIDRSAHGVPNYRLSACAAEPPPLRTGAGFTIDGLRDLSPLRCADTVTVPAWRDIDEMPPEPLLRRAPRRP